MRSKAIILSVLFMVLCTGLVTAAVPSICDVGLVSSYRIQDLSEMDIAAYTPALRGQLFITPWFGLSGDVALDSPFASSSDSYTFLVSADIALRWPLGFFEPYFALGPTYKVNLTDSDIAVANAVLGNARAGFDFNITNMFAVGVEGNLVFPDLTVAVSSLDGQYFLDNTFVGVVCKARF